MRISIDPKDPGFALFAEIRARGDNVRVFFDGVQQTNAVITADADAGTIRRWVYRKNRIGIFMRVPNPLDPRQFATEEVTGLVRLEIYTPSARVKPAPANDDARLAAA